LRVLVVSHAAMLEMNQEPFAALAEAGADVTLVVPRSLTTDIRGRVVFSILPGAKPDVVPLEVPIGGYSKALGGQRGIHLIVYRRLARAVAKARPDVIFVEEEPHSLAAWQVARLAARHRIPFVVHENQNIARRLPQPFEAIRRRVLREAAGVSVRNEAATQVVRAAGYTGRVVEFPHAVDISRFRAGRAGRNVVGYVGRLVAEKGVFDLVEAVAKARAESSCSLLVVGDGPARAEMQARVRALGIPADLRGAVAHDDVPALFNEMDVVAIPSHTTSTWKEQFGRIVIEANACEVPVIVSDSGELPATVAATGGGTVVAERDVDALSRAIVAMLRDDDERARLGAAGRAGVQARFTPQAVAARLLAFLREVAG
jgi:glycosyltransferase involved in cell wall biosynthesis